MGELPGARGTFRAHARKAVRISLSLTELESGLARVAETRNVGLGGLCLETEEPLRVGSEVLVALSTPAMWDPLVLRATVVWSEAERLPAPSGIRFHFETAASVAALVDFLEQSRFSMA
jgi:Tfp pilus assembly protein PilZ